LADIAAQLEIEVETTLSLHTQEDSRGLEQRFESTARTESAAALQGVDIVATWCDDERCWTFARSIWRTAGRYSTRPPPADNSDCRSCARDCSIRMRRRWQGPARTSKPCGSSALPVSRWQAFRRTDCPSLRSSPEMARNPPTAGLAPRCRSRPRQRSSRPASTPLLVGGRASRVALRVNQAAAAVRDIRHRPHPAARPPAADDHFRLRTTGAGRHHRCARSGRRRHRRPARYGITGLRRLPAGIPRDRHGWRLLHLHRCRPGGDRWRRPNPCNHGNPR